MSYMLYMATLYCMCIPIYEILFIIIIIIIVIYRFGVSEQIPNRCWEGEGIK